MISIFLIEFNDLNNKYNNNNNIEEYLLIKIYRYIYINNLYFLFLF